MSRRILLLNTDLEIGGTPTVVREVAIRLKNLAGAHVEVVGLAPAGPLRDQLLAHGIKCTALDARGPRDFPRTLRRLHRLVRQEKIDTVLSFLIHANTIAAALRPLWPNARYLQSIQTTQPSPRWHWSLQRWVHRAADRIIVPSRSVARAARQWSGIPESKLVIIPNAIHLADFQGKSSTAETPATDGPPSTSVDPRPAAGSSRSDDTINVTFIGRLDPIKRLPDLLHALTLAAPTIHLHIYGQGSELPLLQSLASRLNLTGRVIFHGAIPAPQAALALADVLVLPSDAEGFGLVLIEAMAAGVPVIGTNVAGIRDVILPNQTGLLVPPRSPAALAGAIAQVISDSSLRQRLTAAALRDVRRRFTWHSVWPRYVEVLKLK